MQALIQHTEASHGRQGVHRGVRTWEDSRNQTGALTSGVDVASYSYDVDYSNYCAETETWDCEICHREFRNKKDLEQHLTSGIHEEKAYHCSTCDKKFLSLASLKQHLERSVACRQSKPTRLTRAFLHDAQQTSQLMLTGVPTLQEEFYEGTLYFDGGAQPNPGLGGAGYVIEDDRGYEVISESIEVVDNSSRYDSYPVTSNQAEYMGLIAGLQSAKNQGMKRLRVKGDSELVIRQMQGSYRVNSQNLVKLQQTAAALVVGHFQKVEFTHIPRGDNGRADALANEGVHQRGDNIYRIP